MNVDPAAAEAVVVAAAALGLPRRHDDDEVFDATGIGPADVIVGAAVADRVIGPLAVGAGSGQLHVDPDLRAAADAAHREALVWCLRLERDLLDVLDLLAADGIEALVLKGPALAHLDAIEPSLRTFGDLDLLVRPADIDRAVGALGRHGAAREWAERRPGFDRRFAKAVTLRTAAGIELDVHRTLSDGVHGFRIPIDRLWDRRSHFELAGTTVACLSSEHRLLHTAYHLALGSPHARLGSLRDLGLALTAADAHVDTVVAEARRWRGETVLALAIGQVVHVLDLDVPEWERWAATIDVAGERQLVERHRREGSGLGRSKLDNLREIPALRDRAAYLCALAVPSSAHLASRGLRRRDLLRRAPIRR